MDTKLRNQLTGAVIWFMLLIVLVGSWYSHPVRFDPDGAVPSAPRADKAVIVDEPLRVAEAASSVSQPAGGRQPQDEAENPPQPEKPVEKAHQAVEMAEKPAKAAPAAKPEKPAAKKVGDPPSATAGKRASATAKRWMVKVAAYFTARQANDLVATLNEQGFDATYKKFKNAKGQTVYSVRLAPVASRAEALRLKRIMDRRFHTDSIIESLPPQS